MREELIELLRDFLSSHSCGSNRDRQATLEDFLEWLQYGRD